MVRKSLEEQVGELNTEVDELLDKFKNYTAFKKVVSWSVFFVMLAFLGLVPALAITGNPGGALVLGFMFILYLALHLIARAIVIVGLAFIDAETEKVTHKSRNSVERLNVKGGL